MLKSETGYVGDAAGGVGGGGGGNFHYNHTRPTVYRHFIPASVDRTSANAWLYNHPWIAHQKISQVHKLPT